jgi:hypothetical protein
VYAAIRCAAPLAHREIIDFVILLKESGILPGLETVSRTKVRGVLAVLKHAQMFVTHGAEADAVRLHLYTGINSFRELRERHDSFLSRYLTQHHLYIPPAIKNEIFWQLDPEMKQRRCEELKV